MRNRKNNIVKIEKRLKLLKEKLSFYEGKLLKNISISQPDLTESVSTKINHQEAIMLSAAIDDLTDKIEELESNL
ncbi:hypothetical protein A3D05_00635 [Candidatus Gottesmanbacteria bacterium RIFCSPHIGHO2_02_FULL_40_24]|uniref:Uncharacterized protein n=1 Tax=Candidatus Gottesmanbacteria bacterium RIFCSPHIGHO2_01_FULL_40_15 TaxID=1798376 RepID=A0A1F5Z6F0_9BACT|nr:MAG: hypothetical protein A2777_01355 [Candidatus Gottesmanbacteria bacterium RIFCSPHIGHO2_01_FULL_40_15]OGG18248.1 MAG: hypothetical protein A3D05_00635 [Candidatus Gottesmanbacteria bacterium RIFCSPHIGHO2_02_FULL_40_24]OGG22914.1 MAG: hypothetical protein A3B48_01200 [Candidatus Gottesmanbacteria bacterium RIFCSPLOWO2_01_FULL_40_10]OGG23532.1 MAG: hypothetical protein A3E42_00715 [Candidatus Gottesmanbacteria bacterium RIFCSPHIGHO2_12_FULL_40_13]OGG31670.1 MAG: hypothetical protein A3I80_0